MKSYLKKHWKIFVQSFKDLDRRVFLMLVYDMLFFIIVMACSMVFSSQFVKRSAVVDPTLLEQITVSPEIASSVLSNLHQFFAFLLVSLAIFSLIIFFSMCILKILIWSCVARESITIKEIARFFGVRALWLLISTGITLAATPIFILLAFAAKVKSYGLLTISILILFLIWLFFSNIKNLLYINYTKNRSLSAIKSGFSVGIKKVHLFILPYIIASIIFLIFSNLYYYIFGFFFKNIVPLTGGNTVKSMFFYLLVPSALFLAWFRIYFYNATKSIDQKI